MSINIEIIEKDNFTEEHETTLASMLEIQGKVRGNLSSKIDRCKYLGQIYIDDTVVSIGAIKKKHIRILQNQKLTFLIWKPILNMS